MGLNKFKKIPTGDSDLDRVQDSVKATLDNIQSIPIINGQLLTGISLPNGGGTVNHKLGRKLVGWFVSRKQQNQNIWEDVSQASSTSIFLDTDGDVTFDLYVF